LQAGDPDPLFKPEFLGHPYVLNQNIPSYMPRNEADLMEWMQAYLANATTLIPHFSAVFGVNAPYPVSSLVLLWNNLSKARAFLLSLVDLVNSWRSLKNIYLFSNEHRLPVMLDAPEVPPDPEVNGTIWAGLVGMIDAQVRLLRAQPGFNQTHAELLKIIPRKTHAPDLLTLTPNLRAKNTGGNNPAMELSWRGAASIKGVWGVRVQVDRGDGHWQDLPTGKNSRLVDTHPQPAHPVTWVYRAEYVNEYVNEYGMSLGVSSHVSVIAVAQ